jgi:hypothetical protein
MRTMTLLKILCVSLMALPSIELWASPPTVILSAPNTSYDNAPVVVPLTASVTGGDGGISKVIFYDGTFHAVCTLYSMPYECPSVTVDAPGANLYAVVYDNMGNTGSAYIWITANTAAVQVYLAADGTSFMAPATFNLYYYGRGGKGGTAVVEIHEGSPTGPVLCKQDKPSVFGNLTCPLANVAAGVYTYYVVGTDTLGNTSTKSIVITVTTPQPVIDSFVVDNPAVDSPGTITLTVQFKPGAGGIKGIVIHHKETDQDLYTSATGITNINADTGGKVTCALASTSYTCKLTNLAMGLYSFTATAIDNAGNPAGVSNTIHARVTCKSSYADSASGASLSCLCFNSRTTQFTHYPACRACVTTCREVAAMYAYHVDCVPWNAAWDHSGVEMHNCADDSVVGGITVEPPVAPLVQVKPPWDKPKYKSDNPAVSPSPAPTF